MQMPMEMPSMEQIFSQVQEMTSMGDTKTGKGDDQKQGISQMCQKMTSMADVGQIAELAETAEQLAPLVMMAL